MLRELGWSNYPAYLGSRLWRRIRAMVLTASPYCSRCKLVKSFAVHHDKYTKDNLSGESMEYLVAVCRKCHAKMEQKKKWGDLCDRTSPERGGGFSESREA